MGSNSMYQLNLDFKIKYLQVLFLQRNFFFFVSEIFLFNQGMQMYLPKIDKDFILIFNGNSVTVFLYNKKENHIKKQAEESMKYLQWF